MGTLTILREALRFYEEGLLTEGEVGYLVLEKLIDPHIQQAMAGEESGWAKSWCGKEPPEVGRAIIEVGGGKIWFKPVPKQTIPKSGY
jgi:hypothetical protein